MHRGDKSLPRCPPLAAYLWEHYGAIARRRQNGMAPNPITHQGIEAYCNLMRIDLTPWEVDMICAVDDAAQKVWAEKAKTPAKGEPENKVSINDKRGLRSLLSGMAARIKSR